MNTTIVHPVLIYVEELKTTVAVYTGGHYIASPMLRFTEPADMRAFLTATLPDHVASSFTATLDQMPPRI